MARWTTRRAVTGFSHDVTTQCTCWSSTMALGYPPPRQGKPLRQPLDERERRREQVAVPLEPAQDVGRREAHERGIAAHGTAAHLVPRDGRRYRRLVAAARRVCADRAL